MEHPAAYIPIDRRYAMAHGLELPRRPQGAVLFADISGFTALTEALAQTFGPRQGADLLTRRLNQVYGQLIALVHSYGGSIIGFSGDAILCWFGRLDQLQAGQEPREGPVRRAVTCGLAMQEAMASMGQEPAAPGVTHPLAIKTVVAAGQVRRFAVGNPSIRLMDVLAGAVLDRMAAGEELAQQGELLLDQAALAVLNGQVRVVEQRESPNTGLSFGLVQDLAHPGSPVPIWANLPPLDQEAVRAWLLPSVYERLHQEQGRFLAELRPAVALFLRFTGLDFERDPQADAKLDAYVRWVQAVLDRYEGALIQLTTGDKGSYLYAAFGAPLAHSDDADRAVAAALDLRTLPRHLDFIRQVQMGVCQGRMRVGAYGSPERRTYGVLGEATNLAARLMSRAQAGQILVARSVAHAIADLYELEPLGALKIKGLRSPLPVHRVLGRRQQAALQYSALFSAPLVGRDEILARLNALAQEVRAGNGRILRIEGEAGVGKSHLVATFARQAAEQGFQVAMAACQSTTRGIAYHAGRQIARSLLGLGEGRMSGSPQDQMSRVEAIVRAMNPKWLLRLPLLGDLLGLPIPDNATTAAFDPRLRQEALATLAVEIAQTRARQRPLLLILEDVQWIDEATRKLLLSMARSVAQGPVLLVLVHRPPTPEDRPYFQELARLPHQVHILLPELSAEGVARLVRQRLGGPISPLVLALIQEQAQGNAFFTEELVDALRESGRIVLEQGMWQLAPRVLEVLRQADCLVWSEEGWQLAPDAPLSTANLGLPDSIHGIVLSRLDRLPPPAQLTVKVASVIGRVFECELLAQVHPARPAPEELRSQLALLSDREFARLEQPESHLVYIFKHNITQEVIYKTLLENQRQELHLAIGQLLERLRPDAVERLAFHYRHSDLSRPSVRAKTLTYLDAAAQRAQREYANETALNYIDRALALETRWEWLRAKVQVLHILGRRQEEAEALRALAELEETPPFELAYLWGQYFEAVSDYQQAQRHLEEALAICRRHQDREGEARCLAHLGLVAWRQGNYEEAQQAYDQALQCLGGEPRYQDEEAEIRYGMGIVYRQQGRHPEARTFLARALELYRGLGNRQGEARALTALGSIAYLQRDYDQARQFYQEALAIRRSTGDRTGEGASLTSLAQVVLREGDYSQAERLLRQALAIQQAINNRWREGIIWNELGVLTLMVGDLQAARHSLERSLAISQELEDEAGQAYTLCNLGQVLREQGALDEAEALLSQGMALAQAQGDRHLEALYHSELGMVHLQAERFPQAVEQAARSLAILNQMGLRVSTTSDLSTLAQANLAQGELGQALAYARESLSILDECEGEGPDYPHRDYFVCAQVLAAARESQEAERALVAARRLLLEQAQRISDPAMRRSFLENVSFNRAILAS